MRKKRRRRDSEFLKDSERATYSRQDALELEGEAHTA